MRIRYVRTMEDIVAFNKYHFKKSPAFRRQLLFWQLVVFGFEVLVSFFVALSYGSVATFVLVLPVCAALSFLIPITTRFSVGQNVRKFYDEGKNKGMLGEQVLELIDTELVSKSDASESKTKISSLERVETSPDYGFIYVSAISAHIIPRNRLLEGDFESFIQAIKEKQVQLNETAS